MLPGSPVPYPWHYFTCWKPNLSKASSPILPSLTLRGPGTDRHTRKHALFRILVRPALYLHPPQRPGFFHAFPCQDMCSLERRVCLSRDGDLVSLESGPTGFICQRRFPRRWHSSRPAPVLMSGEPCDDLLVGKPSRHPGMSDIQRLHTYKYSPLDNSPTAFRICPRSRDLLPGLGWPRTP